MFHFQKWPMKMRLFKIFLAFQAAHLYWLFVSLSAFVGHSIQ